MDQEPYYCSICQREVTDYGNNAYPVNQGRCCNECDRSIVIPARFQLILRDRKHEKEKVKK